MDLISLGHHHQRINPNMEKIPVSSNTLPATNALAVPYKRRPMQTTSCFRTARLLTYRMMCLINQAKRMKAWIASLPTDFLINLVKRYTLEVSRLIQTNLPVQKQLFRVMVNTV